MRMCHWFQTQTSRLIERWITGNLCFPWSLYFPPVLHEKQLFCAERVFPSSRKRVMDRDRLQVFADSEPDESCTKLRASFCPFCWNVGVLKHGAGRHRHDITTSRPTSGGALHNSNQTVFLIFFQVFFTSGFFRNGNVGIYSNKTNEHGSHLMVVAQSRKQAFSNNNKNI